MTTNPRSMVRDPNPTPRAAAKRAINIGLDVPLILAVFALLLFGALMVFSASWDFSLGIYDSPTFIFQNQMKWMALGVIVIIGASFVDYHYWRLASLPLMGVTLVGLLGVYVVSDSRHNATRTLSEGSFMPGELAKIATIIYLAVWLYSKRNVIGQLGYGLLPLGGIVGVVAGLIMGQPDLSAAATIIVLGGILFFLAGGDLKQIALLLVVMLVMGWLVVWLHPTGSTRVASYLQGLQDPTNYSYHVQRSIEAFAKGGLFGVGIGKGNTKFLGLPVPPTDSIFAVVAEETGWLGASLMVSLFVLLLWRGLVIARRAPDLLGSLIAAGLSIWIAMEAMINMGVMVGVVPFAGNALPFISAGGSNLLVSMAAIGIILNIDRLGRQAEKEKGVATVYAPDGLRRSERRRGLSRPRRSASTE
jgi:cell division protein FtsW